MKTSKTPKVLIRQTRGQMLESQSLCSAVILDQDAQIVRAWGDPQQIICPRSALKPLQALPVVLSKAFKNSPNPMQALALSCASHWADAIHVDFVRRWLPMLGRSEQDLVCGPQEPEGFARAKFWIERGSPLGRAFNNCSGKHTGMLAACLSEGFAFQNYHHFDHPLQVQIRRAAGELSGVDWNQAPLCIDGCGLPNYFVPMQSFAQAFCAFLKSDHQVYTEAFALIHQAWTAAPDYVAGAGDLCTELSRVTDGRVLAKIGAQGNFIAVDFGAGQVTALKIDDGSRKMADVVLLELLSRHGSLNSVELAGLRAFVPTQIQNWAGESVGEITTDLESKI